MYWKILLLYLVLLLLLLLLLLLIPVRVPWGLEQGRQRCQRQSGRKPILCGSVQIRLPSLDQTTRGWCHHRYCCCCHDPRHHWPINPWHPLTLVTPPWRLLCHQSYLLHLTFPRLKNIIVFVIIVAVIVNGDNVRGRVLLFVAKSASCQFGIWSLRKYDFY